MSERERAQLMRLVVISAAWALGEALVWQLQVAGLGLVVPALLAAAAYVATRDVFTPRGDVTYYRGRPIDRDRWRR
jgi:hypothetical protein